MSEFQEVVNAIVEDIFRASMEENGGISINSLGEIVVGHFGGGINCYPSTTSGVCHEIALFVSLSSNKMKKGRGHLPFRVALEMVVKHMQGYCPEKTRVAILITDSWDNNVYNEWRQNIEYIKNRAHFAVYLISDRNASLLNM